jgi:hypothetical protein
VGCTAPSVATDAPASDVPEDVRDFGDAAAYGGPDVPAPPSDTPARTDAGTDGGVAPLYGGAPDAPVENDAGTDAGGGVMPLYGGASRASELGRAWPRRAPVVLAALALPACYASHDRARDAAEDAPSCLPADAYEVSVRTERTEPPGCFGAGALSGRLSIRIPPEPASWWLGPCPGVRSLEVRETAPCRWTITSRCEVIDGGWYVETELDAARSTPLSGRITMTQFAETEACTTTYRIGD